MAAKSMLTGKQGLTAWQRLFSYCSRKWRTLSCDPIKIIADKPEDYSFTADLRTVHRNPGLHQVACKLFLDSIERYLSEKLAPEFWKMLNAKNVDVSFNLWHCVRVKQLIFNLKWLSLLAIGCSNRCGGCNKIRCFSFEDRTRAARHFHVLSDWDK